MLLIVEPILSEFCVVVLFVNTLLSWINVIFNNLKYINLFSKITMRIASTSLSLLLLTRWVVSGHIPLSNLYESCIFLACSLSLLSHFLEYTIRNDWTNIVVAPINLLLLGFANFSLPLQMQKASFLVPALQSNWLMMHVSMMILSYGLLILACILSISFLFVNYNTYVYKSKMAILRSNINSEHLKDSLEENCLFARQNILLNQLDYWSYRLIGIGFPFLTIGILSGAVWANEAWGSYWSWDPKETWAMVTWIIFSIYLHIRMVKGLNGEKPALVASIGLFIVWSCYLGVNLLGKGLHSYGWLN
jgi:cytochrome c-type biogenesis protein CcsB